MKAEIDCKHVISKDLHVLGRCCLNSASCTAQAV